MVQRYRESVKECGTGVFEYSIMPDKNGKLMFYEEHLKVVAEKEKIMSNLQKHTLEHLKLIGDLQIELEKSLLLNLEYEKVLYNKGKVTP